MPLSESFDLSFSLFKNGMQRGKVPMSARLCLRASISLCRPGGRSLFLHNTFIIGSNALPGWFVDAVTVHDGLDSRLVGFDGEHVIGPVASTVAARTPTSWFRADRTRWSPRWRPAAARGLRHWTPRRLAPGDDTAALTVAQLRDVIERLITARQWSPSARTSGSSRTPATTGLGYTHG